MPVSKSWSSGRNQTPFPNLYTNEFQKGTIKSISIGVVVLTWAYNLSIFVVGLSPSVVNHSSTGSFANLTADVFPTLRIPSLKTLVIGQWRPRRQTYSKWNSYNYYTLPVSLHTEYLSHLRDTLANIYILITIRPEWPDKSHPAHHMWDRLLLCHTECLKNLSLLLLKHTIYRLVHKKVALPTDKETHPSINTLATGYGDIRTSVAKQ